MNDQPSFTQEIMPPVGRHQHLCLVYDDPASRVRTTVPDLVDGLERSDSGCRSLGNSSKCMAGR